MIDFAAKHNITAGSIITITILIKLGLQGPPFFQDLLINVGPEAQSLHCGSNSLLLGYAPLVLEFGEVATPRFSHMVLEEGCVRSHDHL